MDINKSIFNLTESDILEDENIVSSMEILNGNVQLGVSQLQSGITNESINIEANSFIIKWNNPTSKYFSYVQVRMSHATQATLDINPNAISIESSEIIYTGKNSYFNYIVPSTYENHYFNFWVCAFAGKPIPTERLEQWSETGN